MTYENNMIGFVRMKATPAQPSARAPRRKASPPAAPPDHRVRTGAARSEQTRRKLIESALGVFAEKGTDAPLIEHFIAAAGVARGTFYNYFRTTQDLLDAVRSELSDEIVANIDAVVLPITDPLQRLVCGCLLYMHSAVDIPSWGLFIARTGFRGDTIGMLAEKYLPRDLELARKNGTLRFGSVRAARDLIFGCVNQGIQSVLSGHAPRAHLREVLALGLGGLGVSPATADALCDMPLPEVALPAGFGFTALLRASP